MIPLSIFAVDLMSENLLLLVSVMIVAAAFVGKAGSRLGTPSLLLFLVLGMLAGPDVLGVHIEDAHFAESVGHFAMGVILFTAGLETSLPKTKPVLRQGALLSTVGVLLTVLITGAFLCLWGIPPITAFLLAAILGSTDSASVFSVLKEKKLQLRENLAPMLELESGSNDPIALTLTVILVQFSTHPALLEEGVGAVFGVGLLVLVLQLVMGVGVGLLAGYGGKWLIGKLQSDNFALTAILVLGAGFFANGLAQLFLGNGLLATYVAAIIIGNKVQLKNRKDIGIFYGGLTWMMQLVMFLILGLFARPSQMLPLILPALGLCLFMAFVARPLSVFACLLPFRQFSLKARALVSWVGLKGAGAILFALYAVVHDVAHSAEIFNFVFLFSLFSLLLQGGSLARVAGKLGLTYDEDPVPETFGMEIPEEMGMLRDHVVTEEDLALATTLREMHLPHGIRVVMVRRGEKFLVPHGSMPLEVGDKLVIMIGESDD